MYNFYLNFYFLGLGLLFTFSNKRVVCSGEIWYIPMVCYIPLLPENMLNTSLYHYVQHWNKNAWSSRVPFSTWNNYLNMKYLTLNSNLTSNSCFYPPSKNGRGDIVVHSICLSVSPHFVQLKFLCLFSDWMLMK